MTKNADERQRTRVLISGEVQGVFFRDSTRQQAKRLNLSGWVTNLPDGRVEAVFEGPPDAIHEAVEWCREGPEHAHVEDISTEHEASEDLAGFEVR